MSATNPPATPSPTDDGAGLDTAEAAISRILARDSGQPGRAGRQQQALRQTPPAQGPRQPPPAEPEPDETLPEPEEDEDEVDNDLDPDTEDTDDAGEDDAPEDEEDDAQTAARDRLVTVKLPDGKTEKIPESELGAHILRQRDYTQKTMALAEERKTLQAEAQAVTQERQQYAQLLPALIEQYKTLQQPAIDWDRLFNENPAEYVRQQAIQRDLQDRQQAALQEQFRLHQIGEAERAKERADLLARERDAMGRLVPAWSDPEKWNKARNAARDYARDLGYSDADIGTVTDHRAVYILWQAAQYDALIKKGRASIPAAPNNTRAQQEQPTPAAPNPGPHPMRRRVSEHTKAKQRLNQTHSLADAAAVIRGLL